MKTLFALASLCLIMGAQAQAFDHPSATPAPVTIPTTLFPSSDPAPTATPVATLTPVATTPSASAGTAAPIAVAAPVVAAQTIPGEVVGAQAAAVINAVSTELEKAYLACSPSHYVLQGDTGVPDYYLGSVDSFIKASGIRVYLAQNSQPAILFQYTDQRTKTRTTITVTTASDFKTIVYLKAVNESFANVSANSGTLVSPNYTTQTVYTVTSQGDCKR